MGYDIDIEGLCRIRDVDLKTAKTLISAAPKRRPDRPTLLEISGYPHYENVASNILAFYLDPAEVHGLGSLLLDALLHLLDPDARGPLSNVNVDREVGTNTGKKLDLLITSDSHIFAIENKIFARPYNPFQEYAKLVASQTGNRKAFKRILGLFAPSGEIGHGFVFLSYKHLISAVRSNLGHYTRGADARYILFLSDFLDTIENLQRGTRMDKEWISFLGQNYDDFLALEKQIGNFKYEMRLKVEELATSIVVPVPIEHKFWREKAYLEDTVYYEIKCPNGLTVVIEGTISPRGWMINIFPRKQEEGELGRVIELTQLLGIPFLEEDYGDSRRLTYQPKFDYEEPIGTVGSHLQAILDKIIGYLEPDKAMPSTIQH
ncbi:MAG TPA: PD-(D/E)XK nuclease family protein [Acetobacteraceae bacterium]|nr:PD-(D/E)XK nuclease family protein [Acetobacteraceae bacterium]